MKLFDLDIICKQISPIHPISAICFNITFLNFYVFVTAFFFLKTTYARNIIVRVYIYISAFCIDTDMHSLKFSEQEVGEASYISSLQSDIEMNKDFLAVEGSIII